MTKHRENRLAIRVTLFAFALGAFGALLFVADLAVGGERPLSLPAGIALAGFFVAGLAPLMLEVQSSSFAFSVSEIPLTLGLLSMHRPTLLVCGVCGSLGARLVASRRFSLKLVFNVSLYVAEVATALLVFDALAGASSVTDWLTWVAAVTATATSSIVSANAVNAVITMTGDRVSVRQAIHHSTIGVVNSSACTLVTLLGVVTVRQTPVALLALFALALLSLAPLRRLARLQRRYDGLLLLHEFTAGLTGSSDLDGTLTRVINESRRVLRAANAGIVLLRDAEVLRRSTEPLADVLEPDDELWQLVMDRARPICVSRSAIEFETYRRDRSLNDLMTVPLIHGDDVIGALFVCNRLGETSTFDADDLSIFSTMANQTTVTLENLRLIDRLRDESAERQHQALHDGLTGLPNRAHLYNTLDECLGRERVAVAVLDLNRFKEVNDTLGHHVGDEVLVQASARLRRALPSSALVARLGGDEFAIMMRGSHALDPLPALASIELAFSEPVQVGAMSLRIDASVGVAMSAEHGTDRGVLLRKADVAMYAAKQMRTTAVRVYDESQERTSVRSLEIVGELRRAIENETIDLVFQPKAQFSDGAVIGVESLARWTHPELGVVHPDEFIPLAEQAGLIFALTDVVLRRSLQACARWHRLGQPLSVAVNVDAQTLLRSEFATSVLRGLDVQKLPPSALTLEITERELVRELDGARAVIDELRRHGVRISIDDFGTGYSSLSYLEKLPVDEIKIDRAFVTDVASSPVHRSIIAAVSDIATALGVPVVAEGLEDAQAWRAVQSLGATYAQGYFLARPMPEAEFTLWLETGPTADKMIVLNS